MGRVALMLGMLLPACVLLAGCAVASTPTEPVDASPTEFSARRPASVENGVYVATWTRDIGTCPATFEGIVHVIANEHAAPDGARGVVLLRESPHVWNASYTATWDVRGTMLLAEHVTWDTATHASGYGHAVIDADGEHCEGDYEIEISQ